jgi:hypothetical protein
MSALDKVLDSVEKAGQIASATNGLIGLSGGLIATIIGIIQDLRTPDAPAESKEQIAARLEEAVLAFGEKNAALVEANAAYWDIPAKPGGGAVGDPAAGQPADVAERTTTQGNPTAAAPPQ